MIFCVCACVCFFSFPPVSTDLLYIHLPHHSSDPFDIHWEFVFAEGQFLLPFHSAFSLSPFSSKCRLVFGMSRNSLRSSWSKGAKSMQRRLQR